MTPLLFLKLALNCIDLLSWPLLALGYPLCASIQAIESDSHSDTRNLISYWILLSLIYLFEYPFHELLQWFQCWPCIKLMLIVWLMIPDFGRAYSVYNRLVSSCISMNPQEIISRFRNLKKLFVKKENCPMLDERYITENGTEALEKLIASENKKAQNLDAEGMKAVPGTEKNEMQQTNKVRLDIEQKDVKDLEMIVKEEVPQSKQGNTTASNLELNVNITSATVQTEGTTGKVKADGEFLESCASKKVQKEWTCAMCQVTTTSEKTLKSHLHGRKHKATCKSLKAKNKMMDIANASKQKITANQQAKIEKTHIQDSKSMLGNEPKGRTIKDEKNKSKDVHGNTKVQELQKSIGTSVGMKSSILRCEMCNVKCYSEGVMASHLKGRKHLNKIKRITGSVRERVLCLSPGDKHRACSPATVGWGGPQTDRWGPPLI